jgi:hypothetical protein
MTPIVNILNLKTLIFKFYLYTFLFVCLFVGGGGRGISIFNKLNNDLWCIMMKAENHFSTQKFATIHIVKTQDN